MNAFHGVSAALIVGLLALPLTAQGESASTTHAGEQRIVWNEFPLALSLPVGEETRIRFPVPVALAVPQETSQRLKTLAPNDSVYYLTPTEAFGPSRVLARSLDGRSLYIIDLTAAPGQARAPIYFEDAGRVADAAPPEPARQEARPDDPVEIVLNRFAAQTLYAPERLVPSSGAISQTRVAPLGPGCPVLRPSAGERYRCEIAGAWAGFGRYLTAVLVINESDQSVRIEPAHVTGAFTHITAQHRDLGHAGSLEDRTTLYLISREPFADALTGAGYGY